MASSSSSSSVPPTTPATAPPPSSTTTNSSSNNDSVTLFRELELAYAALMSNLTSSSAEGGSDANATSNETEKIQHLLSVARRMENFFLERRTLLHSHKPELILKDETMELRKELQAKDELLRRHFDKLNHWQALLQDMQVLKSFLGTLVSIMSTS